MRNTIKKEVRKKMESTFEEKVTNKLREELEK
jgi:hypothetical protein